MDYKIYNFDNIGFFGSLMGVGPTVGYGYAAIQLIEAWQRQNIAVWWGNEESSIAFSMCQPTWYDGTPNQLKIGYTPWESTVLPSDWIPNMNKMDEIWTTSAACKQWFAAAGIFKEIKVLPHGINPTHFPLVRRQTPTQGPLRFLHIGSDIKRKGGLLAYEAFKEVFSESSNVELILKGDVQFETVGSNVRVIREILSQEDLTKLYLDSHFFIYPGYGEGFGLLPFQAAATGMPTLATDWGGMKEFIEFCWPIKVSKLVRTDYEPHVGLWAEPSYESLKYWMEAFADSPNYFFTRAHLRGNALQSRFSWDNIAKESLNWLSDSLERRSG